MTPETSTENRERQPAFSAAGLLAAVVKSFRGFAREYEMMASIAAKQNPTLAAGFEGKAEAYESAARFIERKQAANGKLTRPEDNQ